MGHRGRYHIALVVEGGRAKRLARLTRILAGIFEEYGHPVERSRLVNENLSSIVASHYRLELSILRGKTQLATQAEPPASPAKDTSRKSGPEPWRIEIAMIPADPRKDDRDISELLLAVMLYRLTSICDGQRIEWLSPHTSMSAAEFLDAFHGIAPAEEDDCKIERVRRTSQFAAIEEDVLDISDRAPPVTEIRTGVPWITRDLEMQDYVPPLAETAEVSEQPNDVQRLTVWAMTGMVAFLSAPVAASIAVVNLVRGEDFRLNTHVLALTAFIVTMHSSGALDKAVSKLPL
ncbi:MAG: hypothetical protein AB3N13_14195 [Arenibacterium sp.]